MLAIQTSGDSPTPPAPLYYITLRSVFFSFCFSSTLRRGWVDYYLESEINVPLDNVAGPSVYFGAKHLMAYAQLCLIAEETGRWGETVN